MPDLFALLSDHRITLRSLAPNHEESVICPFCQGGRTREKSLSVNVDADGQGFVAQCWRGKCDAEPFGARVHDAPPAERSDRPRRQARPAPPASAEAANCRPDWLYDFFAKRNIGAKTVVDLGIYAGKRRFVKDGPESDCIVFPYVFNGVVVNRKYRHYPDKHPQAQEFEALPTLYNVDAVGADPFEVTIVEGEPDVAAMRECGVHAISLKDGAGGGGEARFEGLKTHEQLLTNVRRFVLAGDNDAPGLLLREELARRLGRHRCVLAVWPEGCKDACDVLRLHGPSAVLGALGDAQPYPISGLQTIGPGTLRRLRGLPPPAVMATGAAATDAAFRFPTEGRLIVVTGYPSSGKTAWTRFVMVHTAADSRRRWAVFSPEMQPWELFAAECAEVWAGKPFYPVPGVARMTDDDVDGAERFLSDRVTLLVCDSEDEAPTLEWIIEHARAAVLRDGVTDLLIDPWNEIDHQRGAMSETDYIGRCLQRLKAFGLRHGCNIWIVAHPAKPQPLKPGEKRTAPGPYDLYGSSHWANKTDLGVTLHSPEAGRAEVTLWKSRFRRWGTRGAVAVLLFDAITGRYASPPSDEPAAEYWERS